MTNPDQKPKLETVPQTGGAMGGTSASGAYVDPSLLNEQDDGKLASENAELKDKLLRTLAEMENLRRRTEREVKDASAYAISKFAKDILAIADNLHRALETAPAEIKAAGGDTATFYEGVELTERSLLQTLERYGVKPIEAMGLKFDPHLHQAMFEMESKDAAPGTVVQVMQGGFVIGERVLRPAMVGVAKAPAAPTHPEQN